MEKECKSVCKEDQECNKSTGRCKKKLLKHIKKSLQPVKKSPQPVKKSPQPVKKSPQPVKKSPQPVKKSPQPVKKSPQPVKKSPQHVKKSPQDEINGKKKKPCKEDCSKYRNHKGISRECNYDTGRCKLIQPKKVILTEKDCNNNEQLNYNKTKCIAIPYKERYEKFSKYKVYFEVAQKDIEKAKKLGAEWDTEKGKMFYTETMSLGNIYKLNYISLKKPEKKYLSNEQVPYAFKSYAKSAGALWDPKEKKWYYFNNLPEYNRNMLEYADWKHFNYRMTYEGMY